MSTETDFPFDLVTGLDAPAIYIILEFERSAPRIGINEAAFADPRRVALWLAMQPEPIRELLNEALEPILSADDDERNLDV